jgi:hypothetical protein
MDTLEQLNSYSNEELELWLEGRLRAQYSTVLATRYSACDFRQLGVPSGDSHIDQLVGLFKKLSIRAQGCFRRATEQLLRHAQPGDVPAEVMSDLVFIVGLIKAYRALKAFVPVFGNGPWGELHRSLIYDALSVLLMFDRTGEAYNAARGLATSVHFPDIYVFDAYLILIRSRPERWFSDFGLLRERFSRLRRFIYTSGDLVQIRLLARREREFATSLVQAIPLSELAEHLATLRLGPSDSNDGWLVDNLFGSAAPLRVEYSADDTVLCVIDRSNSAREAPLPSVASFEAFLISRRYLSDTKVVTSSGSLLSPHVQALLKNCSRKPRACLTAISEL